MAEPSYLGKRRVTGLRPKPPRESCKRLLPKPTQRPIKPGHKNASIEANTTKATIDAKAEVSQSKESKQSPHPPPAEPTADGYYELNPLMMRMVEAELQDIMIKVWQELPDNPVDVADDLVVDKLRNKAGDDLRNVLGLNITKRLLNIHNPLYVKIQFSGKPEKIHLSAFLKKYNFNAFKRIENSVNTFAAQVRSIADFDRICSAKDIRCGTNVKVTVTPCYRFTKCPPNLRTAFNETEPVSDSVDKEKGVDEKIDINPVNATKVTPTKENKVEETIINKEEPKVNVNEAKVSEVITPKPVKTGKDEPKTEVKVANIVRPANEVDIVKPNLNNVQAITPNKGAAIKNVVNKPELTKKIEPTVTTQTNKTPASNNNNKTIPSVDNKDVANKQIVNKSITTKKVQEPKSQVLQNVKTPVKGNINKNINADKPTLQPKQDAKKTVNKEESDFDELDDHDILALMSEGIVLDECTGSDDD